MSSTEIQFVIYLIAVSAMMIAVFGVISLLKDIYTFKREMDNSSKNSDWVIDYCAGKPYKKGLK